MLNFSSINVCGDIHGGFRTLLKSGNIPNSLIIQVGDFGAGYPNTPKSQMKVLNDFLKKENKTVFAIRGNHDKPNFFDGSVKLSNLWLVPDYTRLTINDKEFGFIGGAVSIDRHLSTENWDYWKDEKVIFDKAKAETLQGVDVLITHTAPLDCFPLGWDTPFVRHFRNEEAKVWGTDLFEDLKVEREMMTELVEIIRPKHLYYGHFHKSNHNQKFPWGKASLLAPSEVTRIL